jgi:hypothetical protein
MDMLVVVPWTKYGNDRLYVRTAGGYEVDELDRRTGIRKLDGDAWATVFDSAVADFEASLGAPTSQAIESWLEPALRRTVAGSCVEARA